MIGLLERDHEVATIRDGIQAAVRGDGRCLVVEGPAGIGKSTLVAGGCEEATRAGVRVLHGAGGVLEVDFPYGVVRQLFEPVADRDDLFAGAAELARPVLSITGGQERGDSAVLEALHGLYWLTANLAAEAPLLMAVDDAHWCDGASLRFLVYLRRRLEGLRVLVLIAARPGEAGANQELIDLLADDIARPAALTRGAVASLLAERLAETPDDEFGDAAYAATQGNPFLMRELVTALVDGGIRPTADAVAGVEQIGLEGVSRAILRRLAGLGEGATALARAVAILGGDTELAHAAALAGLSEDEASEVVASLVRTEILRDERRLSFVHPLVRAAIYTDVPAPVRSQSHRRAAGILAEGGMGDDAVAAHLMEARPAGDPAVVGHLRAAAGRAAAQGAMDVAANYLRRAAEEPPGREQRADVLRELGTAELAAGRPDAAAERLAAALAEARDVEAKISIGMMRRHALVLADRIGEAVEALDAVRREVARSDAEDLLEAGAIGAGHLDFDVVRGNLLEAGVRGAGQSDVGVAPSVPQRLERLRQRAADPAVREPLTLAVAAFATASSGASLEDANSLIDRAIACLGEAHPHSDYTVEGQLVVATMLCDRFEEFRELSTTWLQDARRSGSIPRFISMATMRAHYHYRVGELEEAKSDAHDALEAGALYGHHFWVPGSAGALINPLVDQGRLEEAERVLADSRVQERHGHSFSAPWATMLLPARGRLRIAQGRPQEGLQDLLACGERYESAANRSPTMWAWRSEAAQAFLALGEHDRACELAREELDLARGFGAARALGIALRVAGIVEGSTGLLEEAVQVLSGSPAQLESARALVDLGGALRRAGQRTEAREHLRQGLELALRCGADALAERAREELLTSGAHLRRERLSGPAALTPSELRVARMAAVGHSNPEIAQALFLTRRTVETHLTHAYQKLGIGSRGELATALRD